MPVTRPAHALHRANRYPIGSADKPGRVRAMTPRTLGLTDPLHQYLMQVGLREHEELKRVREETAQLPGVHMLLAPEQAQLMALLARLLGVRRYLEIGTYTGYSALAIALALEPEGRVVISEIDQRWPRPRSDIGVAQASPTRSSYGSDRRSNARCHPCARRAGTLRYGIHRRRQGKPTGVL